MELTSTARGSPALILNGYKYLVVNRKNDSCRIYWRCAVNRMCIGSVIIKESSLVKKNVDHTHYPGQD